MDFYTAQEITDILIKEGADINLRTVRYYTQLELVPPLELHGNKRVYTVKHLHYFRAVLTLSKTGETLASIQETLSDLSIDEIKGIAEQFSFLNSERIVQQQLHMVNEDIYITINKHLSSDVRQKVIDSVTNVLKGNNHES
ncbi:MerR family transcriptional regulator [Cytobacillus oceanisediminis]|uniref:MerR family transcriptional regulator n=1 Tax=Cytobacillus oceanisediminis TaxID=665099 RepID=UPI00254CB0DA|nr:MerR family transcriptional regulator [Cytobacillus oceanisediminis]MDK7669332.1 MerR family transcriptional regulator [Cytobacillus oceanisediminis]